jgi:transcriptional regulator with XRE-family HTH domain
VSTASSGSSDGEIGSRIRDHRIARNMTQRDLAGDRYSVSYISAIERGKVQRPSQEALQWCAARLGVSVLELLGESVLVSPDGRWMQQQLSRFAYEQVRTQMLITSGINDDVAEGLQRARKMRRDGSAPVERALIWFSAYGSYLASELAEAQQEAETYRKMVDEAHDARGIAAYHWLMGHIVLATGDIERAHLAFARALDAEPNAPGSPDAAQALRRALAASLRALHDPARAHQVEAEALREYERFANPRENSSWSRMRAEQAAEAGDYLSAYLFIRWAWNSQREAAAHRHAAATYLRHATYPADDVPAERRETELRSALELAGQTGDEETQVLAGANPRGAGRALGRGGGAAPDRCRCYHGERSVSGR